MVSNQCIETLLMKVAPPNQHRASNANRVTHAHTRAHVPHSHCEETPPKSPSLCGDFTHIPCSVWQLQNSVHTEWWLLQNPNAHWIPIPAQQYLSLKFLTRPS
eukprot:TRINITY_DN12381_c0_g1_i2.p1 TRINITY_DN12381_c0_g1~~TRINITY_DN12381_c0_g1_i2.p1  ORF type:complete len:103 (+),score=9.39 TRINITY_DN12381_c0_g1_i2:164-472(+)